MANKPKTINFSDKQLAMLEEIKEKFGYSTITQVIHYCLTQTYKDEFKDYVMGKSGPRKEMTPEELVQREEDKKKAKEQEEIEKGKRLCERLDGTLISSGNGFVCEYFTHSKHGSFKQSLPINQLSEEIVQKQWQPDRATVEAYRNNHKKDVEQ